MKINVFCWDRSVCTNPYINIIMIQAFSTTPEAYLNPQTLPLTGVKVTWNNEASGLECQLSNQILITSQRSRLWPLFKFSLNLTTRQRGAWIQPEMEVFKFFSICFVLVSLKPRSEAYEVRKEYLFNNWWNRVLIKIFANKQVCN